MTRALAAVAVLVAILPGPVRADTPLIDRTHDPGRRAAIDGAHRQMATCAAFFVITAEGIPPASASRPALQRLAAIGDLLVMHMLRLQAESVTRARIEAERRFLVLAMGGGLDGYPGLRDAFGEPCETIASDPQAHVDRWLAGRPPVPPPAR